MTVTNFLENEVVDFASYSTIRAIASLVDGFKNSGRKVAFTAMKRSNKETKVSILAGIIAIECLSYDTLINLSDGTTIKIGDWATKYPEKQLEVLSVNDDGEEVIGIGHSPVETKKTKEIYEIDIDGEIIECTDNHLFFVKRENGFDWVEAQNLKEGDDIVSYK